MASPAKSATAAARAQGPPDARRASEASEAMEIADEDEFDNLEWSSAVEVSDVAVADADAVASPPKAAEAEHGALTPNSRKPALPAMPPMLPKVLCWDYPLTKAETRERLMIVCQKETEVMDRWIAGLSDEVTVLHTRLRRTAFARPRGHRCGRARLSDTGKRHFGPKHQRKRRVAQEDPDTPGDRDGFDAAESSSSAAALPSVEVARRSATDGSPGTDAAVVQAMAADSLAWREEHAIFQRKLASMEELLAESEREREDLRAQLYHARQGGRSSQVTSVAVPSPREGRFFIGSGSEEARFFIGSGSEELGSQHGGSQASEGRLAAACPDVTCRSEASSSSTGSAATIAAAPIVVSVASHLSQEDDTAELMRHFMADAAMGGAVLPAADNIHSSRTSTAGSAQATGSCSGVAASSCTETAHEVRKDIAPGARDMDLFKDATMAHMKLQAQLLRVRETLDRSISGTEAVYVRCEALKGSVTRSMAK
mmetsp:Transcript_94545/g.266941  ORF Transcript_94545/g.266941 Transcript_94545/m.266941 type:complete len:485 (+) Transcript_94545:103-1557(+)